MFQLLKKLFFVSTFNGVLFIILIIGIQNSHNKRKIDLIFADTVKLPISFIIGASFISGSILGSFLELNSGEKKAKDL